MKKITKSELEEWRKTKGYLATKRMHKKLLKKYKEPISKAIDPRDGKIS